MIASLHVFTILGSDIFNFKPQIFVLFSSRDDNSAIIIILIMISNVVMARVNSRIHTEGNKNLHLSCFEMTGSVINL